MSKKQKIVGGLIAVVAIGLIFGLGLDWTSADSPEVKEPSNIAQVVVTAIPDYQEGIPFKAESEGVVVVTSGYLVVPEWVYEIEHDGPEQIIITIMAP